VSNARGSVRRASSGDVATLASLLDQLGYPTAAEAVGSRLKRLLSHRDVGVFVYELDGETVGLAAYQLVFLLERAQPQCRLTALVVDNEHRRLGVAAALLDAVEAAARRAGCFRLEVTTQPRRDDALAFYIGHGFYERPRRLVKELI
jgi:GNAT superfamily N-acetyltransferase